MNRYLEQHFESASEPEKDAFIFFLDLEDPVLFDWVIDHSLTADTDAQQRVLVTLRSF